MFSCSNFPRGCRGRCDISGGKCKECSVRLPSSPPPWPLLTVTADIQLQMPALIISVAQLQIPISTTSLLQVLERTIDTGVYVGVESGPDGGVNGQMIYGLTTSTPQCRTSRMIIICTGTVGMVGGVRKRHHPHESSTTISPTYLQRSRFVNFSEACIRRCYLRLYDV